MRLSADAEKKEAHLAKSTMGSIEKAAAAQYGRGRAASKGDARQVGLPGCGTAGLYLLGGCVHTRQWVTRPLAITDKHELLTETTFYGRSWEPDAASGYLYNAVHRHYFQPKTGMYYGGDPPAWTLKPSIPAEALYSDGSNGKLCRGIRQQPRTCAIGSLDSCRGCLITCQLCQCPVEVLVHRCDEAGRLLKLQSCMLQEPVRAGQQLARCP